MTGSAGPSHSIEFGGPSARVFCARGDLLSVGESMVTFGDKVYQALFDTVAQPIVVLNGEFILYANGAAAELFGRDATSLCGSPIGDYLRDDPHHHPLGITAETRALLQRADGTKRRIDVRTEPLDLGGERAIRLTLLDAPSDPSSIDSSRSPPPSAEFELRAILRALADHFFRIDSHGRILEYNAPEGASPFMAPMHFIGRPMQELLPVENVEAFTDAVESAIDSGRVKTVEYTLPIHDKTHHFEARIVPYAANRLIALVRDVTERKLQEQQALVSQKLESIERLAGGIAHDFNNLLTTIVAHGELARFGVLDDPDTRHHVSQILAAAERASDLTRKLLAFSRNHLADLRATDVRQLVEQFTPTLRRTVGLDVQLRVLARSGDLLALADARLLERAILAIVTNAAEAMPNGGTLTLALRSVTVGSGLAAKHFGLRQGRYVGLFVRDGGFGMDAETLKRAFDPFFTTKVAPEARGLGLPTAHGIVKQLGGQLFALSKRGRGTTIAIYLPCSPPEELRQVAPPKVQLDRARGRVLLVEDEPAVREIVALVLRNTGYEVTTSENGVAAEQVAERIDHDYDALVTDVTMPQMGGRELAQRLRTKRPRLPVLYLSGYTQSALSSDDLQEPLTGFLQKPFTPVQLATELDRLLMTR